MLPRDLPLASIATTFRRRALWWPHLLQVGQILFLRSHPDAQVIDEVRGACPASRSVTNARQREPDAVTFGVIGSPTGPGSRRRADGPPEGAERTEPAPRGLEARAPCADRNRPTGEHSLYELTECGRRLHPRRRLAGPRCARDAVGEAGATRSGGGTFDLGVQAAQSQSWRRRRSFRRAGQFGDELPVVVDTGDPGELGAQLPAKAGVSRAPHAPAYAETKQSRGRASRVAAVSAVRRCQRIRLAEPS